MFVQLKAKKPLFDYCKTEALPAFPMQKENCLVYSNKPKGYWDAAKYTYL